MKQIKFKVLLFAVECAFSAYPGFCDEVATTSKTDKVANVIKKNAGKVKSTLSKAKDEVIKGLGKGKEKIMNIKLKKGFSELKSGPFTPDDFKFDELQHIDVSKCEKPNVVEVKSDFEKPIWFAKTDGSSVCINIRFRNEGRRTFYKQPCLQGILMQSLTDNVGNYGQGGFDRVLKENAISLNVVNTDDNIVVSISCLKEHYGLALSMLRELLTQSNLPESTIEQKKLEYISEINQLKSDTTAIADEKLSNIVAIPEYDYSHDKSLQIIPTYTRDDVVKCYKQLFDPRNAEITVVGNISTEQLVAELNKFFDVIKDHHNEFGGGEQKTELKTNQSQYEHVELDNPNTTICFALPGVALTDEDRFAIYTVNRIWGNNGLTSRLFRDIRETQHLVYTIHTVIDTNDLQVYLHGRAKTNPQYVQSVITGIMKQLQDLHDKGITEKELSDDKVGLVTSYVLDSPESMLYYIVGRRNDGSTIATINEHFEKYSKLTVADVNKSLKKVFDPSKLVVVSCGKTVAQVSKATPNNQQKVIRTKEEQVIPNSVPQTQKSDEKPSDDVVTTKTTLPIEEAVLENGLRVVVCNVPTSKEAVYFGVGYFVGSADDPRDIVGASHFLEHMAFKESKNMPAGRMDHLLSTFNKYTNAFTCDDITFYTQHCNKAFLDANLRMESERMSNAKFLDDTVADETNVILAEREMRLDSNPYVKYIEEIVLKNFYLYSNYSYETVGYQDQIKACIPHRLEEHYKKFYVPNNAVALFVGDITLKEAKEACERNFGHIKRGAEIKRNRVIDPADINTSNTIVYKNSQISQKKLSIVYKVPREQIKTFKQAMTIAMINDLLFVGETSVINEKINNKLELAYDIGGYVYEKAYDAIPWYIDMTLKTNDVDFAELETKTYNTINDFLELKPQLSIQQKFEKTKNSFKLRYERMKDEPGDINWFIINNLLINNRSIDELKNVIDIISSITFDEFMETAKDLLNKDRRVIVVRYAPADDKNQKCEKKD